MNSIRREMGGYAVSGLETVPLADVHAPFDFPKGLPCVCCPVCGLLIPGAPSAHLPLADRITLRTKKVAAPEGTDVVGDCWVWTGSASGGYGTIMIKGVATKSHRAAYEVFRGVIPDGLVVDHLCRVTLCCNPDHLEAVTQQENVLRGISPAAVHSAKTHCKKGHEFNDENTYLRPNGEGRACRVCKMSAIQARRDERYSATGTNTQGIYAKRFKERQNTGRPITH